MWLSVIKVNPRGRIFVGEIEDVAMQGERVVEMSVPTESTENIIHIDPNNQEVEVIVDDSTEGSVSEEDEFDAETEEDDTTNDEAETSDSENVSGNESD